MNDEYEDALRLQFQLEWKLNYMTAAHNLMVLPPWTYEALPHSPEGDLVIRLLAPGELGS